MMRKGLLEGVCHGVWSCLGDRQERRASPTESNAAGAGRIASRNGCSHARHEGGTIGLMQTVVHGGGQERILATIEGMHEQGRATTVKDGIGPAYLGWQDSAGLRSGEFKVRDRHNQGEFWRKRQCDIVVLSLYSV